MKNIRLKLLITVLIMFSFTLFLSINGTRAIYREVKSTTIDLTVLDPSVTYSVTLDWNDGDDNTTTELRTYGQELGNVPTPTRANYNFLGWYDGTDDNANRIYSDQVITGPVTFYAKWQKIICKKVTDSNNLHIETCVSGGCRVSGTNIPLNSNVTYGTIYGPSSPIAGDAYDCDVNNDGTYDAQTEYGKFNERFYFLRQVDNGDDEATGALVYYTGFDSTGAYDSQHAASVGSTNYSEALTWLPTSSSGSDPWDNPDLIDFDANNGKISRFLNFDDLSAVCGSISSAEDSSYFTSCGKWFLFENSRFQSKNLGRAGIWLQPYNNHYYRIHTESLAVAIPDAGSNSANTARPVIEIPISAFEGYQNTEKHTISFNTHGGLPEIASRRVYTGDPIGAIDTVTKKHFAFDGWYAEYSDDVYSAPVTSATIVDGDMTLHAKWNPLPTNTVTFDANGGTINGESTFDLIVDTGSAIDENDFPEAIYQNHSFDGWFTDSELTEPFDETEPIIGDIRLYAGWVNANYVARVNGVGYETLEDAIAAVPTGKVKTTVTILKNITLSDTLSIPSGKWVELAGSNHTISGSLATLITNSGNLDIIDGTNITTPVMSTTSTLIANASGAILNISGGNLTNPSNKGTLEFLTVFNNGGTLNITGGVLNSYGQSASINNKSNGIINVSDGEIIAHNTSKGQAIYMESGTVNISGVAYLENVSGTGDSRACVDNNGGTLNITGGTIVSKGYSAVIARKGGATTNIGTDDDIIDISTPVLRGQRYGLERTAGTAIIKVYDGIFESIDQAQAISTTDVTKPTDIEFKTDGTVDVDGVTYHAAYLLTPSVTINFYEENGGTAIPVTVDNGTAIGSDLPTPNPKQGYYFVGWFINGNPLQPVTAATVVTGPLNAYAIWAQSVSNATMDSSMNIQMNTSDKIEFVENDIEPVTYSSGNSNVATVDADGTVHGVGVGTAIITITGDLSGDTRTVTVTVTPVMHTVKFYDSDYDPNDLENSTLIDTIEVEDGSSIGVNSMPTLATNSNYVFNAWYINGNSGLTFTSESTVTGDIVVVANWKEKITYATLTTSPTPFELFVGNTGQISLSPTTQGDTVEDYTFSSGNETYATVNSTTGQVSAISVGDTYITVTGSLSGENIQVPVSVDILKHAVTFKDGDNVIKTVMVEDGSSVDVADMPLNLTKTNYIFNGWVYTDNNNLIPFTSETEVYGDIDVVASWKETLTIATLPDDPLSIMVGTSKEILVTATGGGSVEDYTLSSSNTNLVEINNKEIFGVDVGSITLTITGVESNVSRTITVDVVNSYNVIFDPDNGDEPTVIPVEVGSTIDAAGVTLPTDPTKTDYVFDRWYLYDEANETLTSTPLDTSAIVTSNITYKAKWVSNTYYAAIGSDKYYTSLKNAISAVTTSDETEIRIIQDIPSTSGQTKILSTQNIVLNGGNHSVSCGTGATKQLIFNQGTLKIVSGTFTCNKSGLAVLQNESGAHLYISGGKVHNYNNRGAIFNNGGAVEISGGELSTDAQIRPVVQNAASGSSILITGGTITQESTTTTSDGRGAIKVIANSSATIKGGTVISKSTSSGAAAVYAASGTLVIGTQDGSYDASSPVIQGEVNGIDSAVTYSIYDGIIKGKNGNTAVNDFGKITGTETGSNRLTGTDGDYYTLYYEIPNLKYRIEFNASDGTVTPTYKEFDLNSPITASDLPTPTRENHVFGGWYTDVDLETPFVSFTPTSAGSVTYYAKWSFDSSITPVTHNILSNAMQDYFGNVSSWVAADLTDPSNDPPRESSASNGYDNGHHLFKDSIQGVFTSNSCSYCGADNACSSPQAGTYCDYSSGYDTGLTEAINVYSYENNVKGSLVTYTTSSDGVIYNMIPGKTYYWESQADSTKYGVVTATGERRTLKTNVRNLRDLGGLAVSYTDLDTNQTVTGTIDYGRLYRGAQITSSQGVTDLTKLGITREIDLRENGEGIQTYKLDNYDVGTKNNYTDIVITNYIINPEITAYFTDAHLDNYKAVKNALRKTMEAVVNGDNVFFHCTIGTDRTGTLAYFLEGLLGVSEEDRLRDYELTYFFGLTNRTRFHDTVSWSSIKPRFYSMYRSYPTNQDIYNYYKYQEYVPAQGEMTDDELLTAFRNAMIKKNS